MNISLHVWSSSSFHPDTNYLLRIYFAGCVCYALYASFFFDSRSETWKNEKLLWPKIRFEALKGRTNQNENMYSSIDERIKVRDALTWSVKEASCY